MIHTAGESFETRESVAAVSVQPDTAVVTIPDAHLLFTAEFKRKGSDLVLTGDDGHKILVPDYFRHDKQPDLVSPEGALLSASLVELLSGSATPGQYAQATALVAPQPIGRVETVSGSVTVTRNGVAVDLNVGDLVFQGDVVQTRSDSTLGIGFADGSAFSLKENARMALNEFVYDPNGTSNSALISLVQGTVSFIAAQVAKTGNMRVDTPTATLGIRGTFVTVDVSSVDGHTVASLGLETNPTTGEQFAGTFTLTNRITGNQVTVNQVNSMFSVSPAGLISESAKPLAMQAIEQASFQALSAIAAATAAGMGAGPTAPNQYLNDPNSPSGPKAGDTGPSNSPAPGGSGGASPAPTNTSPVDNTPTKITFTTTPTVDTPPANTGGPTNTPPANTGPINIPTNPNQPNILLPLNQTTLPPSDIKPTVVATDTPKTDTPKTETPTSQPATNNPATITSASATGSFSEIPNHTNDTTDHQVSGTIAFADPALSDTHTVTQGAPTFTWSGGTLTPAQQAALTAASTLAFVKTDSTGTGAGSVAWTHKITDSALDFLAAGETLTATYNVTINDGHGGSVTQTVTVIATGTNDVPTIVAGSTTATGALTEDAQGHETGSETVSGTIAFKDVDLHDTHTVNQAAPTFTWSGGTLTAAQQSALTAASTLTLVKTDSTGTGSGSVDWTYQVPDSAIDFLAVGETLTVTYDVTITDNNGASISQPLTVTVAGTGTNDAPVIAADDKTETGAVTEQINTTGSATLDSAAGGTIHFTDVDLTDTPAASITGQTATALKADGITPLTLTSAQADAIKAAFHIAAEAGNTNNGAVDWTYQIADSTLDFLAAGEKVTLVSTVTVNDNHGGTDTANVTVTITGANDAAVIGDPTVHDVTEDVNVSEGKLTASGAISITDADQNQASFQTSVTGAQGNLGSLTLQANGNYSYTVADSLVQYLGANDSKVDTFTVAALDGTSKQVSFTIHGANDAPVITVGASDSATAGLTETNAALTTTGTLTVNDADLSDTVTPTVASVTLSGVTGGLTSAAVLEMLTVSPSSIAANPGHTHNLSWSFNSTPQAFDFLAVGETLTATYNVTINDGHAGTATQPVTVTITGTNDAPTIAAGSTATGTIDASSEAPFTSLAQSYLTAGHNLINGLGGSSGFGENDLARGDDNSSAAIDIRPVFGAAGINFFGHTYTSLYINNNGNLTFGSPTSQYTPSAITANASLPIIAPFWADVDTRSGSISATSGGISTGANPVHYDLDSINGVLTVTWDDVGYYSEHKNLLDAFQVQLINVGNGDFDIVFRYEDINWTTGDASRGSKGLGGTVARAGYSTGDGVHYFELSQSGSQSQMLALESTIGNTGIAGVDVFEVRNGSGSSSGTIVFKDADLDDTHTVSQAAPTFTWSGGTLSQALQSALAAASTLTLVTTDSTGAGTGSVAWTYKITGGALDFLSAGQTLTATYNVTIDDHHRGTVIQPVTVTIVGTVQDPDWIAGSGNWEDGANWDYGVPSANTATVIAANGTYTVSINSGAEAYSLALDNSQATLAVGTGHSLTVTDALTVDAGSLSLSGGTIQAVAIDLENVATLQGFGTVSGAIANSGLIEVSSAHVLNIDGNITGTGSIEIPNNATLELSGSVASTQTVSFAQASTLVLDHSLTQPFSAAISGLDGDDNIDLKGLTFTSDHMEATTSFANGNTTLVVSNTSTNQSVTFTLAGDYTHSEWDFARDSAGTGTIFHDPPATDAATVPGSPSTDLALTVTAALTTQDGAADQFTFQGDSHTGTLADASTLTASGSNPSATDAATPDTTSSSSGATTPTATATMDGSAHLALTSTTATSSQPATSDATSNGTQASAMTQPTSAPSAATGPNGDTFVFAANFGHETITNFHPDTDVIAIDHTAFADFQALLAAAHDDGNGNAVITANPHDTITVKNVTVAQLVQHQGDFHFT